MKFILNNKMKKDRITFLRKDNKKLRDERRILLMEYRQNLIEIDKLKEELRQKD